MENSNENNNNQITLKDRILALIFVIICIAVIIGTIYWLFLEVK